MSKGPGKRRRGLWLWYQPYSRFAPQGHRRSTYGTSARHVLAPFKWDRRLVVQLPPCTHKDGYEVAIAQGGPGQCSNVACYQCSDFPLPSFLADGRKNEHCSRANPLGFPPVESSRRFLHICGCSWMISPTRYKKKTCCGTRHGILSAFTATNSLPSSQAIACFQRLQLGILPSLSGASLPSSPSCFDAHPGEVEFRPNLLLHSRPGVRIPREKRFLRGKDSWKMVLATKMKLSTSFFSATQSYP